MVRSCPLPVIGFVRNNRKLTRATPVQSGLNPDEQAVLELNHELVSGLDGLAGFDYAWLLTWLGDSDGPNAAPELTLVPFLLRPQRRSMGIFATRGPRRINPIGLSLVRLLEVSDNRITFAGVDMVDGTPVLDLKPYVTAFDRAPGEPRCGWFDTVRLPAAATPDELTPHGRTPHGRTPDGP
jgi:tRNA-Thr(GGU) m(6)t(6)A37 methyltransferase TsaA